MRVLDKLLRRFEVWNGSAVFVSATGIRYRIRRWSDGASFDFNVIDLLYYLFHRKASNWFVVVESVADRTVILSERYDSKEEADRRFLSIRSQCEIDQIDGFEQRKIGDQV
jgi:hypothetical protein